MLNHKQNQDSGHTSSRGLGLAFLAITRGGSVLLCATCPFHDACFELPMSQSRSQSRTEFYRAGQRVAVRSAAEIAATLDANGRLDGTPFMPEMVAFAGRELTIHRHSDKTCVEGGGLRQMQDTLLLAGVRCDGTAHDGCQRGCLK